ncbi:MAG: hypothetical protein WD052_09090 [Bacteroidales bacterium]
MKKIAILLLVIITASSCSLFEKPSMTQEEIDQLVTEKAAVEEELANLHEEYDLLRMKADECAQMLEQQANKTAAVAATGRYYVIAGSFKTSSYADEYSAKVRQNGGEGTILQGPYNFNLVAYSSHASIRDAIESLYVARTSISDEAWVYRDR